jgi:hypothetical protein
VEAERLSQFAAASQPQMHVRCDVKHLQMLQLWLARVASGMHRMCMLSLLAVHMHMHVVALRMGPPAGLTL